MDINYDCNLKQLIDEKFDFLDLVSVPMSVIDVEKKVFVKTNTLFDEVLKIKKSSIFKMDELIKSIDVNLDDVLENNTKETFGFFKTSDSTLVPLVSKIAKYNVGGKVFILLSHVEVMKNVTGSFITQDFPYSLDVKNILENIQIFACILSLNKKEIMFANNVCRKIFGGNYYRKSAMDYFYGLDELEVLDNKTLFTSEFDSIIGSKWFRVYACYITLDDNKSILILGKDISKKKKIEDMLIQKATTDDLTKIYNRQAGIDFLNDYLNITAKEKSIFSIAYINVTDVKEVRDKHGIVEGDNYIITIVNIIRGAIRQTDVFSRMYDSEFLLIFPNCAEEVVENIMTTIKNKIDFINSGQPVYNHAIDYGIVEINNNEELAADDVLKKAKSKF